MFEVRKIVVSVSPLERGLRGVLKLAIRRNDNTPPAPSQEGKVTLQLLILVEFDCNLYSFVFDNKI